MLIDPANHAPVRCWVPTHAGRRSLRDFIGEFELSNRPTRLRHCAVKSDHDGTNP